MPPQQIMPPSFGVLKRLNYVLKVCEIDALLNGIMWSKLLGGGGRNIVKLVMLWSVLTGAMTRVGRNLPGI